MKYAKKLLSVVLSLIMLVGITTGNPFSSYAKQSNTATVSKNTSQKYNIKLAKTSYTYDGKVKKPSITVKDSKGNKINKKYYTVSYSKGRKNVGKYTVTIKLKGKHSGKYTKTFTIKPKGTSITKLSTKNKNICVKWKKQSTQTSGYQIQYSTSSKFKDAKTVTVSKNKTISKTLKPLETYSEIKKAKYYVRIRTYKTVKIDGKSTKIYSSWSKTKNIKSYVQYKHMFPLYEGKIFDTQEECKKYDMKVAEYYDSLLEKGEISWEEYLEKSPIGYEVYKCACGKRLLVFWYRGNGDELCHKDLKENYNI